jgi:hypothetical protein
MFVTQKMLTRGQNLAQQGRRTTPEDYAVCELILTPANRGLDRMALSLAPGLV